MDTFHAVHSINENSIYEEQLIFQLLSHHQHGGIYLKTCAISIRLSANFNLKLPTFTT